MEQRRKNGSKEVRMGARNEGKMKASKKRWKEVRKDGSKGERMKAKKERWKHRRKDGGGERGREGS